MKSSRLLAVAGAAIAMAGGASSVLAKSVAYYAGGPAHLIDWQSKQRAWVVNNLGTAAGTVADDGSQRLVTFDTPFSEVWAAGSDACGSYEERHVTEQLVVRDLPGSLSQLVSIGADVVVGGCLDGQRTPFGTPADEGQTSHRLAMSARPPMTDITPGLQLAGPGEQAWAMDYPVPTQDVVTVQGGAVAFHATGHVFPATIDAKGWWVFDLDGFQHAYTRLEVSAKTGGETWLAAEWANGQPQRVAYVSFVKTAAGAGFGTVAQASRMWQSGLTVGPNNPYPDRPFYLYMYKNGTGAQVLKYLDTGEEFRTPTTWSFDGNDVVHRRETSYVHIRRWVPLRNEGDKRRWVLETTTYTIDGQTIPGIPPRVNYYLDTGKAVPPAAR